jgi:hypothetical protein
MLVATWMGESEKNKQNEAFVDDFCQRWDDFESIINSLRQEIMVAVESVNEYNLQKIDEIFKGIRAALSETASAGHSIDHFFEWVKLTEIPELKRLEKEFGI